MRDREMLLLQVGGPLWVAHLDGTIVASFGVGLREWGISSEEIAGTSIYDWPDWPPFAYALEKFTSGEEPETIVVRGKGPFRRTDEYFPIRDSGGELIAIGCYCQKDSQRISRWRVRVWSSIRALKLLNSRLARWRHG